MKSVSPKSVLLLVLIWAWILLWVPDLRAEIKPRLAMLPFFIEKGGICPICKAVSTKGEILPGSQKKITRLLQQKMEASETFDVLSLESVEGAVSYWEKGQFEERIIPTSIQIGKDLNVDFILVGFLFRFEERIGSSVGVEKPASVSIDLHLFRLKDGKVVWGARFDETQRPISEDLLKLGSFFRRKASWLKAEDLAGVGMDEMLKGLPGPKELEEMP
jgi:hypothetical protein